jgi:hypothetical protein
MAIEIQHCIRTLRLKVKAEGYAWLNAEEHNANLQQLQGPHGPCGSGHARCQDLGFSAAAEPDIRSMRGGKMRAESGGVSTGFVRGSANDN